MTAVCSWGADSTGTQLAVALCLNTSGRTERDGCIGGFAGHGGSVLAECPPFGVGGMGGRLVLPYDSRQPTGAKSGTPPLPSVVGWLVVYRVCSIVVSLASRLSLTSAALGNRAMPRCRISVPSNDLSFVRTRQYVGPCFDVWMRTFMPDLFVSSIGGRCANDGFAKSRVCPAAHPLLAVGTVWHATVQYEKYFTAVGCRFRGFQGPRQIGDFAAAATRFPRVCCLLLCVCFRQTGCLQRPHSPQRKQSDLCWHPDPLLKRLEY